MHIYIALTLIAKVYPYSYTHERKNHVNNSLCLMTTL